MKHRKRIYLWSGLHYVHQLMIAARVIASMKMSALLSYRVAMRLESLSLANMFSTLWRCLYCVLQKVAGDLRRRLGGIHRCDAFGA